MIFFTKEYAFKVPALERDPSEWMCPRSVTVLVGSSCRSSIVETSRTVASVGLKRLVCDLSCGISSCTLVFFSFGSLFRLRCFTVHTST